jgi:hypothetical protein
VGDAQVLGAGLISGATSSIGKAQPRRAKRLQNLIAQDNLRGIGPRLLTYPSLSEQLIFIGSAFSQFEQQLEK